jgi:hypothetical protein
VRWAAHDTIPLSVSGPGLIDCHLYRQTGRVILHLVNLTSAGAWRSPVEELIPVGPLQVRVKLPTGITAMSARKLVSAGSTPVSVKQGWVEFEVKSVTDHEVVVIS